MMQHNAIMYFIQRGIDPSGHKSLEKLAKIYEARKRIEYHHFNFPDIKKMQPYIELGKELLRGGMAMPPYSRCTFNIKDFCSYIVEQRSEDIMISVISVQNKGRRLKMQPIPWPIIYWPTSGTTEFSAGWSDEDESIGSKKEFQQEMAMWFRGYLSCLGALGSNSEQRSISGYTSEQNISLVEMGRKASYPVTLIKLASEPELRSKDQASAKTSYEISPHDRRGHYRTLKNGKSVYVRASKVKGGSNKPYSIH